MTADLFRGAVRRILRPLVRAMIARGLTYPQLSELLKDLYVDEAARSFALDGKRVTDSRVSLLTGLQRRDVKAHRQPADDLGDVPRSMGPVPRVLALWRSDPVYAAPDGAPAALPRVAGDGPSFDSLVWEIGRDMHPRTILDELVRLGAVVLDETRDEVALAVDSLVPSRDEAMLIGYYAANLGDHAEAAAANLMAAPEPGPFFERAVHYNHLSEGSVAALDAMARERLMSVLRDLDAAALERQRADAADPATATERFRAGAFIYRGPEDGGEP